MENGRPSKQHHVGVAAGADGVVGFLDDLPVVAVVQPPLLEPFLAGGEHLPAAGLHALQHLLQRRLDTVAAGAFLLALGRRVRGLVLQQLQLVLAVLLGQSSPLPLSCCRPSCGQAHGSPSPQGFTAAAWISGTASALR
jgi:hypothetical protein